MLFKNWTYDEYFSYIHEPKHLINPVRNLKLFESPILEIFTMTPFWAIPLFWFPVAGWHISKSTLEGFSCVLLVTFGILSWSFFEYVRHRFVFHMEHQSFFIRHPIFYLCHFLVHGVHHAFPNDHYRNVAPPHSLGMLLYSAIFHFGLKRILPIWFYDGFVAGVLIGYAMYDSIHFQLHFSDPK